MKDIVFTERHEQLAVSFLRIALAVVFIWFGAMKMIGHNLVYNLVAQSATPILATGMGLFVLGLAEVIIGLLLLSNRLLFFTHTILILHLLGTFTTILFGWDIIFDSFPLLSFEGEFVVKNLPLIAASLLVLIYESRHRQKA